MTPMTAAMFCDPAGHDWQNDRANRQHPDEGLTCSRCGVTEAELDAMEHGQRGTYTDGNAYTYYGLGESEEYQAFIGDDPWGEGIAP